MKRHLSLMVLAVLAFLVTGCPGMTVVTKVDPEKKVYTPGLFYYLPKTVIVIDVPVTCKEVVAGDLYYHWDKAFGSKALKPEQKKTCKLGDISISTRPTPDLSEIYKLELESGFMKETSGTFTYDEDGNLIGFKASSQDKAVETFIEIVKFGAGLAAAMKGAKEVVSEHDCGNDIKCVQAVQLGKTFRKLEGWRDRVLGGNFWITDPESTINFIDAQEKLILSQFVQKKETTKTWRFEYTPPISKPLESGITPDKKVTSKLIFNFDNKGDRVGLSACPDEGVESSPDLSLLDLCNNYLGNAAELTIEPVDTMADKIKYASSPTSPCCPGARGLRYRLPGRAKVVLRAGACDKHKVLAYGTITVAQFGSVLWLPADLGGLGIDHDVTIYPATGALKMVTLTSHAIDPSKISGVGEAVAPLLKKEEEKSEEQKELEQLTTEANILEQKVKIQENKEKLGGE